METRPCNAVFFFELCIGKMQSLEQFLHQFYPNIFQEPIPLIGKPTLEQSFKMIGNNNDQLQMFMKAVTNNSLSERDLLLSYSIGSFYNELNIFLKQNKKKDSR